MRVIIDSDGTAYPSLTRARGVHGSAQAERSNVRKETKMSEINEALAAINGQITGNTMATALAGVEGKIALAPEKIPAGKTLVAIRLARGDAQGVVNTLHNVVEIEKKWIAPGLALAIRNRHIVAEAPVFGHCSEGVPKVTACHWLRCPQCGARVLQPVEVWRNKEIAEEKTSVRPGDDVRAKEILAQWGRCPACKVPWETDRAGEKASLAAFAKEVFDAIAAAENIPKFLPPRAFRVGKFPEAQEDMGEEWAWLVEKMNRGGSDISDPEPLPRGAPFPQTIVYNPETEHNFWMGWVDDPHQTGLFWIEGRGGRGERRRRTGATLDLGAINGL